jgi:hypothetical protein
MSPVNQDVRGLTQCITDLARYFMSFLKGEELARGHVGIIGGGNSVVRGISAPPAEKFIPAQDYLLLLKALKCFNLNEILRFDRDVPPGKSGLIGVIEMMHIA